MSCGCKACGGADETKMSRKNEELLEKIPSILPFFSFFFGVLGEPTSEREQRVVWCICRGILRSP